MQDHSRGSWGCCHPSPALPLGGQLAGGGGEQSGSFLCSFLWTLNFLRLGPALSHLCVFRAQEM